MTIRLLFALALALPAFVHAQACAPTDKDCLVRALRAHPMHKLETWREVMDRPLIERIEAAPESLVQFLTMDNQLNG